MSLVEIVGYSHMIMVTLPHLLDHQVWPLTDQEEILLKKTYARIMLWVGYDIGMDENDIEQGTFVSSNVEDESEFQAEKAPKIPEHNRKVYGFVDRKLIYRRMMRGGDEGGDDGGEENDNMSQNGHKNGHNGHIGHGHDHLLSLYNLNDLHYLLFSQLRNDTMDTPLLRFLRARKHNLEKSLEMGLRCLNWRVNVHRCDDYLFEGDAEVFKTGNKPQFIDAFRLNQAYLRGYDNQKRPLVVIHVKKHQRRNCPDEDFERFICLIIEWVRLRLQESKAINKGSILFDMTGFGLKNADLAGVKFLAMAFEANYPEYLGCVLIHNAPWIFNTVWKIIKGWLDPVVASKIHFTYSTQDLQQFIDAKSIPKLLGGDDNYQMQYIDPTPENSDRKPIDDEYKKLVDQRTELTLLFVESTINWFHTTTPQDSYNHLIQRLNYQRQLLENYVKLDPYVRTRGAFDRSGEIKEVGV